LEPRPFRDQYAHARGCGVCGDAQHSNRPDKRSTVRTTRLTLNGMRRDFARYASHSGFLSGRSISSYMGTWVLSNHDSSAAPQTAQIASPVCGTKNFSSVRLYSAPQLH
jgi:hypothetical protein